MLQQPTAVDAFARGVGIVQQMQMNSLRQQIGQNQLDQQMKQQEAIAQAGQTGDTRQLMGINPELGMKIKDWLVKQPPEGLEGLQKASSFVLQNRNMLNPQTWPGIRKNLLGISGVSEDMLPPESANAQQLMQFGYGAELIKAQLEGMSKGPKVAGGKIFYKGQWIDPGVSEAKRAELDVKGRGVAAREAQVDVNRQKLDIDRQKAEQEKYPGLVGTSFKLYRRLNGREPNADELEEFHSRFVQDMAKTKNPAVLAAEMIQKDFNWQAETDPAKKRQMRQELEKELAVSINQYRASGKKRTPTGARPRGLQDMTTDEIKALILQKQGGAQ